jgi:DNA-binding MarR family transcriptional regulator
MTANRDIQVLMATLRAAHVSPRTIAERTGLSGSDVSHVLAHLQDRGLITRERSPHDRRHVVVAATDTAQHRRENFRRVLGDYFADSAPTVKEIVDLATHDLKLPVALTSEAIAADEAIERLAEAGAEATPALERAGQRYGLVSLRERYIIALIGESADLRPSQVADQLHLSRTTASETLAHLDHAGLVTRLDDPDDRDRRAVHLRLTSRGRRALRVQHDTVAEHLVGIVSALACTLDVERVQEPGRDSG